ncbi:MAG TPA: carboxypeptidase-like regulatory domain-containing protein [Ignavibacteriaceae bacterium]|nr:carboxypeptidase-like regulatory domain-containing protein [Ignavibacteriaceae bacterium]
MLKKKINLLVIHLVFSAVWFSALNCNGDKGVEPPPPTTIKISVRSAVDSTIISGANVVLYNANSGEPIQRAASGNEGSAVFTDLNEGSYYVRIAAQGFRELPSANVSPIPFSVSIRQTYEQSYYLDTLQGVYGKMDGYVNPTLAGFLIVAVSVPEGTESHSYSGPDGFFALFNVPFGTYQVYGVKSGFNSSAAPEITLTPGSPDAEVQLTMYQVQGSTLSGMVTFLASENGIIDISILDKNSHSVVSGLTTEINADRNYVLNYIPSGDYTAWASYENDGYVMDPDWIFKNPGALDITFTSQNALILNFSVTDAITIISPTNPDDLIIPVVADSTVPTFRWDPYPQAKEYIIEVRDINGNLVWGGFDENGIIRHSQILRSFNSVIFNFDGSALSQLQEGQVYQWKIYADDDIAPDVQTLLSSSEDQKGLFMIP